MTAFTNTIPADISDISSFSSDDEEELPNADSTATTKSVHPSDAHLPPRKDNILENNSTESVEKAASDDAYGDGLKDDCSDLIDKHKPATSPTTMPVARPPRRYTCVALVSGGKDSCFAMMEAKRWGHSIAVLANLCPARKCVGVEANAGTPPSNMADEDLNSFMFQTVGHTAVDAISQAMGLPLVRIETRGIAVDKELLYRHGGKADVTGDEVYMRLNQYWD